MQFIKVCWLSNLCDDPLEMFSETDHGYEVRKVEIYGDGRIGYADHRESVGGSFLGESVIPPVEQINAYAEFEAMHIDKEYFEAIWDDAHRILA